MERKYIAGYFPYNLKMLINATTETFTLRIVNARWLENAKPILRPISDLYKSITHNGKEIIPIVELAKIHNSQDNWVLENKCAFGKSYFFSFCGTGFSVFNFTQSFPISNQYQLFDYLNELKIDYRGLIDAGLAVSVYDLEINPYK